MGPRKGEPLGNPLKPTNKKHHFRHHRNRVPKINRGGFPGQNHLPLELQQGKNGALD